MTVHSVTEPEQRKSNGTQKDKIDISSVLISKDEFSNAYGKIWDRLRTKKVKDTKQFKPNPNLIFKPNDMILVLGNHESIQEMVLRYNVGMQPIGESKDQLKGTLITEEVGLAEILITPRSIYIGQEIVEGDNFGRFEVQILRVTRQNEEIQEKKIRLKNGDTILIRGTWKAIRDVQSGSQDFIVIGKPSEMASQMVTLNYKVIVAVGALVFMVVLMATGVLSPEFAALLAAVIMVIGRAVTMEQAYRSITWYILIIIAGERQLSPNEMY